MSTYHTNLLRTAGLTPIAPVSVAISDTTPTQLTAVTTPCKTVMLQANPDNTSNIRIGTSGADNQKIVLAPGQILFLPVENASLLYGLAEVDNESLVLMSFR